MSLKPLHRDDMDPEMLKAIEEQFQKLYPGYKVCFTADAPEGSEAHQKSQETQELILELGAQSLEHGTCIDCGAQMPDYRPNDDDWEKPEGWGYFTSGKAEDSIFIGWQCPDCDAAEKDGVPRPFPPLQE